MKNTSAKIFCPLIPSIEPELCSVECTQFYQIPGFQIVGLPAQEVHEAKERVWSAIQQSELEFPKRRVLINLSPSKSKKQGTGYDLAIALSVLISGVDPGEALDSHTVLVAWGELSLYGEIKPVGKVLRLLLALAEQKQWASPNPGRIKLLLHPDDAKICQLWQARWANQPEFIGIADKIVLVPVSSLLQAFKACRNSATDTPTVRSNDPDSTLRPVSSGVQIEDSDLNRILEEDLLPLNPYLEKALLISLTGLHHLLLIGKKGMGKSYCLKWAEAVAPNPPFKEWIQHLLLHEESGDPYCSSPKAILRKIHPQVRPPALLGSLKNESEWIPGELQLANNGFLIADEIPEWPRDSKESLRLPLEQREVTLARSKIRKKFPARFTLLATGNLCPCGGWPDRKSCRCSPFEIEKYKNKISGPLLDRIDLCVCVSLSLAKSPKSSESLREKISEGRAFLREHHLGFPGHWTPFETHQMILKLQTDLKTSKIIENLRSRSHPRLFHRIVRIASTLGALNRRTKPNEFDLNEAENYTYDPEVGH